MKIAKTKKRIIKWINKNQIINNEVNDLSCTYFVLSDKKAFSLKYTYLKECNKEIIFDEIKSFLEFSMERKIYFQKLFIGKDKNYHYVFSKKPIKKNKISVKEFGLLLGIPKCCVEKYCEEDDGNGFSYKSCERYFNQLKKIKRKDKFDVAFKPNDTGILGYGFVPCSPDCPKALNYIKKLKKAEKFDLY